MPGAEAQNDVPARSVCEPGEARSLCCGRGFGLQCTDGERAGLGAPAEPQPRLSPALCPPLPTRAGRAKSEPGRSPGNSPSVRFCGRHVRLCLDVLPLPLQITGVKGGQRSCFRLRISVTGHHPLASDPAREQESVVLLAGFQHLLGLEACGLSEGLLSDEPRGLCREIPARVGPTR